MGSTYSRPRVRLGNSESAQRYAIADLDEAVAYLAHPVLGELDAMKLRSSLTLYAQANDGDGGVFAAALLDFYDGVSDGRTLAILDGG